MSAFSAFSMCGQSLISNFKLYGVLICFLPNVFISYLLRPFDVQDLPRIALDEDLYVSCEPFGCSLNF